MTIEKKILDELVRESGHKNRATAVRETAAVYLRQKKTRTSPPKEEKKPVRYFSDRLLMPLGPPCSSHAG